MKLAAQYFLPILCFTCFSISLKAQNIPAGYKLLYEQNFEGNNKLEDFEFTDARAWELADLHNGKALELSGKSNYTPKVRSPHNIAILKDKKFGSFILEADLQQTGKEYGHRDLCLFFGMEDPENFYYVHMASVADPHAHNIFLVNNEPRIAIAKKTTEGSSWGETEEWHKVRLERNIESGTIKVFFDDMTTPIMEAEDQHFDYGHLGFGSFDDTGRFDNIMVWGPQLAPGKKGFFQEGK